MLEGGKESHRQRWIESGTQCIHVVLVDKIALLPDSVIQGRVGVTDVLGFALTGKVHHARV